MLTGRELKMLNAILEEAIIESIEGNNIDPEFHDVAVSDLNPFDDEIIKSSEFDSLALKGFIECSGTEGDDGEELLEYVCITPKGLEALKQAKGVHL